MTARAAASTDSILVRLIYLHIDFLCFMEMVEGSLRINGDTYYRCSTLLFLTLDENK